MNNKLNAIRTFLRVAEAGSFSAAARQLGIKQSAVSQQIVALEAGLGVVLLHRTTRVMVLTAQGEYYRGQMRPILEAMLAVESQLSSATQQWQGKVNIQLPGGLGRLFLPHLLALQKANPGLNLTLSLDDRISDLAREGVDIAFRLTHDAPDVFPARKIARIETPLFASPRFPPIVSLDALALHPHVRFSSIDESAPLRLVRDDETVELAVNTVFRANSSEGLLQALQADIGVGGMQLPLAMEALKSGALVRILPAYRHPDRFLYAVFPDARFIPVRVRGIATLIEKVLADLPGVN